MNKTWQGKRVDKDRCVFLEKWIQLHVHYVIQNALHRTEHLLTPCYKINLIPALSVGFPGMNVLSQIRLLIVYIHYHFSNKRPVRQQSIVTQF